MDALRSALQPITHNLPTPVEKAIVSLLGPTCYKHLILDLSPFTDGACLKLAISKALGVGIICAASIVKVPQILKLVRSRSGRGVSVAAYALETASFVISLAYSARRGYAFSTYGETALIAVQNVVIGALVLAYAGRAGVAAAWVAVVAAGVAALFGDGVVDMPTLTWLQAGAGALSAASKLPQIWTIYQEGGTGQLSAFAVCSISLTFPFRSNLHAAPLSAREYRH